MCKGEDSTKTPGEQGSQPVPPPKDQPPSSVNEVTSPHKAEGTPAKVETEPAQEEQPPSPGHEATAPAKTEGTPAKVETEPAQKEQPPSPGHEATAPAKTEGTPAKVETEPAQKDPPPLAVNGATTPPKAEGTTAEGGSDSAQQDQQPPALKGETPAQTIETRPATRTGEKTSVTVKQAPLVRVRSSFYTWCKVHKILPCDESLRWYLAPLLETFKELRDFDENPSRDQRAQIEACLTRLEPLVSMRWDGMVGAALLAPEVKLDRETQGLGTALASWSCALRGMPHASFEAVFPTRSAESEHARYTSALATVSINKSEALVLSAAVESSNACLRKADSGQVGDPNDDVQGRLLCADLLAGALLEEPLIDARPLDDAWASIIEPVELGTLRGWHADEHDMSGGSSASPRSYPLAAVYTRHWAAWNDAVTSSSAHALCAPADKLVEEEGCSIEGALGPKIEATSRKQGKPARLRVEYTSKGANRAVLDLSSGLAYLTDHYSANRGTEQWVPLSLTPKYEEILKRLAKMAPCRDLLADASPLSPTICFAPLEKADILPLWSAGESKKKKEKKKDKAPLEGLPLRRLCLEIDRTANKTSPEECEDVLKQLGWITNGYSIDRSGNRRSDGWQATESYHVLADEFDEAIDEPLARTAEHLAKRQGDLSRIVGELVRLAKLARNTDAPVPKRRVDLVTAYCLTNLLRFRLYQRWMEAEIRKRAHAGKNAKLEGATLDTGGTQGDHLLNDLWSGLGRFAALSGFNVPMPMALRRWLRAARLFRSYKWTDDDTNSAPHPFGSRFPSSIGDPNSQLWSWAERACPLLASLAPESVASEAEKPSASAPQKTEPPKDKGSEKSTQDGLVPEERRAHLLSLEEAARAACRRTTQAANDAKARKDETEARAGLRQACREAAFATDYLEKALALCPGAATTLETVQGAELMYELADQASRAVSVLLEGIEAGAPKSDWAAPCREARDVVASARDATDASRQANRIAAEGGDCANEARGALEKAGIAASAASDALKVLLEVVSGKGDGRAIKASATKAAAAAKQAREHLARIKPKREEMQQATADLIYCALHLLVSSSVDTGVLAMYALDRTKSGGTFFYVHGGGNGEETPRVEEVMPCYSAMLDACEWFAVQMADIAAGRGRSHAAYMKDKKTLVRTTWGGNPKTSSGPAERANARPVIPPTPREIIGIRNEGNQCYRNAVLQLCAALDLGVNFLPAGHQPAAVPVAQAFVDGLRPAARAANYLLEHAGNPATAYSSDFASTDQIRRAISQTLGWPAYSQQDAADALRWIIERCERPVAANVLNEFNLGFRDRDADGAVAQFQQVIPNKLSMLFEQRVTFTHPDYHRGSSFSITFREAPRSMLEIPIRGARSMADLIATELSYVDTGQEDNRQNVQFGGRPYQDAQPTRRVWRLLSAVPQHLIVQLKRFVGQRIEVPAIVPSDEKGPSPSTPTSEKSPTTPSPGKLERTPEKGAEKELEGKGTKKPEARFVLNKSHTHVTDSAMVGIELGQATTNYRLIAFVVHLGDTLAEGHYVAYVKAQGRWYKTNDEVVTEDAPDWQQMAELGYLYLYERVP